MKRRVTMVTLLACITACAEPGNDQAKGTVAAPALRRDAANVCRRDVLPIVLELLPRERGYRLNTELFDSTRLANFFKEHLTKFRPERRIVYVRLDSGRVDELRWLVPAIERAGGRAYEPDSMCSFVTFQE